MTKPSVALQTSNLPNKPGVYQYYDIEDKLLYVGKAKNVKKRITQHFTNVDSTTKKNNMLREIADSGAEKWAVASPDPQEKGAKRSLPTLAK